MSVYGDEHHQDVLEYHLNDRPVSETFKEKKKEEEEAPNPELIGCLYAQRENV